MQGRIKYLDMARCIALLWIVGFWHLQGSLTNDLSFWGDMDITCIMVGLFMFLSGFFMSKYRFDGTWKSFFSFMQKRFKRFYILYMIATILFFGIGYFGEKWMVVFTTLTALSTYILPQPLTLWFISMLFSFYFVTPFIMKHNIYYASSSVFYVRVYTSQSPSWRYRLSLFLVFPSLLFGTLFRKKKIKPNNRSIEDITTHTFKYFVTIILIFFAPFLSTAPI